MNSEILYHIGLSKEDINGISFAILTGDPNRIESISYLFESNIVSLKKNREYYSTIGTYHGIKILVMSTGIGSPAMAIAVEELSMLGIENIIRVGTCGGMNLSVNPGDLVIAQAAIRQEGTTKEYIPIEYPAVADIDLIVALSLASKKLGYKYHTGIVQTKDSYYGQHNPESMPQSKELINKWNSWIKGCCLASEMETSTLFVVSKIRNIKAASILLCVWNQEQEKKNQKFNNNFEIDKAFKVALNAIELISK